jgi:hypothetical protein
MNSALRVLCCVLLTFQSSTPQAPQQAATATPKSLAAACQQPCLEDATPVKLRMSQTVSSADAHVNDRVEFEVLEDTKVGDVTVIPKGGIAWGTVTEAQPKRRMARGGKLEIVMDSVRLADGEKAALRASKEGKGGGHVGAMTAGIVATGLLFFPAAPFFLFMHGKDVTFPKGTELPTFVDGDFRIDLSKFQKDSPALPTQADSTQTEPAPSAQAVASAQTQIVLSSTPSGADIELDGAFVGSTPSTVGVAAGDHVITIVKKGFKSWERKIKVTTGKVEIAAELEPNEGADQTPKPPNE